VADISEWPGIAELQARTLGDPGVVIALIDGRPDIDHACFRGADVQLADPLGLLDGHPREDWAAEHATLVASVLFGRSDGGVPGVAPHCRGLFVVGAVAERDLADPSMLARAVEFAVDAGATIIHCAFCLPRQSGSGGPDLVQRAFDAARDAGIVVVAPAGNDFGSAWCIPATRPETLAVGSVDDAGVPAASTNHGDRFAGHGVMVNGTRILGAKPGGGTVRMRGTSCAAPVATGVLALLLSELRRQGRPADGFEVARAMVASARPYRGDPADAERCLGGLLDPLAALDLLVAGAVPAPAGARSVLVATRPTGPPASLPGGDAELPPRTVLRWRPAQPPQAEPDDHPDEAEARARLEAAQGMPLGQSLRLPARVSTFGSLVLDVVHHRRREQLTRVLAAEGIAGAPEDPVALLALFERHPAEAAGFVWQLVRSDGRARFALQPEGPYAADVWALLIEAYRALHLGGPGAPERISVSGVLTTGTVRTATGTELGVLALPVTRGIAAWSTMQLAAAAAAPFGGGDELVGALADLLDRAYHDLADWGTTAPGRALAFSVTNPMAPAWSLARVAGSGYRLEEVTVRRSTFARPHSDCWDVVLAFRDPERRERARWLHRHTVDVADVVPVSVGEVSSWFESARRTGVDAGSRRGVRG
jgi:cyanobactin maturation PatA/PatG family protease